MELTLPSERRSSLASQNHGTSMVPTQRGFQVTLGMDEVGQGVVWDAR